MSVFEAFQYSKKNSVEVDQKKLQRLQWIVFGHNFLQKKELTFKTTFSKKITSERQLINTQVVSKEQRAKDYSY